MIWPALLEDIDCFPNVHFHIKKKTIDKKKRGSMQWAWITFFTIQTLRNFFSRATSSISVNCRRVLLLLSLLLTCPLLLLTESSMLTNVETCFPKGQTNTLEASYWKTSQDSWCYVINSFYLLFHYKHVFRNPLQTVTNKCHGTGR